MNTNTTSSKSAVRFTLNFFDKTITGTKASFDKAGKGFGAEYEELTAKMTAHPDYELVIKEQKHKATKAKRTYEGMDTKFIKDYIATLDNAKVVMVEYNAVQKMAKDCDTKAFPLTKKWFLGKFGEDAPFDMAAAKERITDFRLAQVTKSLAAMAADTTAEQEKTETTAGQAKDAA